MHELTQDEMDIIDKIKHNIIKPDEYEYFSQLCKPCLDVINGGFHHQQNRERQLFLFLLGKITQSIIQVGFGFGYETLMFLIANNTSKIYCFNETMDSTTLTNFTYLSSVFPDRLVLLLGDPDVTIKAFDKLDKNGIRKVDLIYMNVNFTIDMFESCYNIANFGCLFVENTPYGTFNWNKVTRKSVYDISENRPHSHSIGIIRRVLTDEDHRYLLEKYITENNLE